MFRFRNIFIVCLAAVMTLSSCDKTPKSGGDGVRIDFTLSGTLGAPFSDLKKSTTASVGTRALEIPDSAVIERVPVGTTLWIAIYKYNDLEAPENSPSNPDTYKLINTKSYIVRENALYPCSVDEDGNYTGEDRPLYLGLGKYFFRAMGPARQLVERSEGEPASLYLNNGEYVIANDERYPETASSDPIVVSEEELDHLRVPLKTLINQTARLKFTLYSVDPFVHNMEMQTVGVEISGLQNRYDKAAEGAAPWNWSMCSLSDTLIAYPGQKNTLIYLREPSLSEPDKFVIETAILPTDAVSTPLIVLFNMNINGNPTQFEMMLNRKMFRAAYSYHYRGQVTINEGISAIEWQSVSWTAEVPIL